MHVFLSCGDATPALTSRRNAVLSYSMRLLYLEWSASGLTTVFICVPAVSLRPGCNLLSTCRASLRLPNDLCLMFLRLSVLFTACSPARSTEPKGGLLLRLVGDGSCGSCGSLQRIVGHTCAAHRHQSALSPPIEARPLRHAPSTARHSAPSSRRLGPSSRAGQTHARCPSGRLWSHQPFFSALC